MNKFLDYCFKFGKGFMVLLLGLVILASALFIFNSISLSIKTYDNSLDYKFNSYAKVEQAQNPNNAKEAEKQIEKLYKSDIEQILQENNVPNRTTVTKKIMKLMLNVYPDDRKDFVANLSQYYKDIEPFYFNEFRKEAPSYVTNADIRNGMNSILHFKDRFVIERYIERYEREVKARTERKAQLESQRRTNLIALLVSLYLFVMFLIVPILIRIEENTRK